MEDEHVESIKRFIAAIAIAGGAGVTISVAHHVLPRGVGDSLAFGLVALAALVCSWMVGFAVLRATPVTAGLLRAGLLVLYVPLAPTSLIIPLLYSCMFLGDCL